MKIALIRQRYTPYGGAERFVERALSALSQQQSAQIDLITRSWEGAPAGHFQTIVCDPPYSRLWGGRAARDRSFCQAVQQHLDATPYDIVQSHERIPGCQIFRAGDGVHAAWLAYRARQMPFWARYWQAHAPYHRYVLARERAVFTHPKLQAVICNSQMVAQEIRDHYGVPPEKIRLIYNGIDLAYFHPEQARQQGAPLRQRLGLTPDTPLLLFVGSGFERKGLPTLLRAMTRMHRQDAHLAVVGADRKLARLQQLAARLGIGHRIHFAGPQKEVRTWYGAANAFVLPTLYDPCPNAVLEALACGLPTLTSTHCGAKAWIEAGKNGWICDPLDTISLARHLDSLCELASQTAAHQAARAGVSQLSLERMSSKLIEMYRDLHNRKTLTTSSIRIP